MGNLTKQRAAQRRKKAKLYGGKPGPTITGGQQAQEAVVVEAPPAPKLVNPEVAAQLATPVSELMTFPHRALSSLAESKVKTIGDLLGMRRAMLKAVPGMTDLLIERIRIAAYDRGLDDQSAHLMPRPSAPASATPARRTRRKAA